MKTSQGSSVPRRLSATDVGVVCGRVTGRRERLHDRVPELDHLTVPERDVVEVDASHPRGGTPSRRASTSAGSPET